MKKFFMFFMLLFFIFFSFTAFAGEIKPDLSEILEDKGPQERVKVIVKFVDRPTDSDISAIESDGASVDHRYNSINAVAVEVPAQAADVIANRPFVDEVEPDYDVKLVLDSSVDEINANEVWANSTGNGIDVAIIDTGIDNDNSNLNVEREIDYTGEGTDDLHGHGTHVAGIVASTDNTYRGVAHGSDLLDVKVLNQDGIGYGSDVINGIEWAVDNGAEIISLSLGAEIDVCDGTDAISRAVDSAVSNGVTVVVAAGNSGSNSGTITTPGCSKEGFTVGASDGDNVASFSSRGPTDDGRAKPDIVAPGVSITSTWNDGSFRSLSGTSMATPHVSGVAALLLEENPDLSVDEIKTVIRDTAIDLGLDENTQGAGKVNAYEAYLVVANETIVTNQTINETINETENETENNLTGLPPGIQKRIDEGKGLPPGLAKKLPEAGLTPDSRFYPFKRFFEKADLAFTFNPEKKAEKKMKLAEKRLAETLVVIERGQTDHVDDLINEYQKEIEESSRILEEAESIQESNETDSNETDGNETDDIDRNETDGNETADEDDDVTRRVEEATSKHLEILREVRERVPENAKSSIDNAINKSSKGRDRALEALRKNRNRTDNETDDDVNSNETENDLDANDNTVSDLDIEDDSDSNKNEKEDRLNIGKIGKPDTPPGQEKTDNVNKGPSDSGKSNSGGKAGKSSASDKKGPPSGKIFEILNFR